MVCVCSVRYILVFGKRNVSQSEVWRGRLMVAMLLLSGGALLYDARKGS
ncbi:hypothetical protein [Butyricicoccus sp. Marseille-Q5471]|nr:hypothetical protein [Butyricicoccus sp. Marseille-Q5471]